MNDRRLSRLAIVSAIAGLVVAGLACGRQQQAEPTAVVVTATATATAGSSEVATDPEPDSPTSTPKPGGCADGMRFVADVTVPDGAIFGPDESFIKTWRIRNSGSCDWSGYRVVFSSGEPMGTAEQPIADTEAGGEIEVSIEMTAPGGAGSYTGRWQVRSPGGAMLGTVTCVIAVQGEALAPGDEPAADVPADENPPADAPAADEPAADEPGADEPSGEEPVVDEPPAEPPTAPPANLQVGIQEGDVIVTWDDATGESGYSLEIGSAVGLSLGADVTYYTWHDPPCGQSLGVMLLARTSGGAEIGRLQTTVNTPPCGKPDLVVSEAHYEPDPVGAGDQFVVVCTVVNQGNADAASFKVRWRFVPAAELPTIGWTVGSLAAGRQTTLRHTVASAPDHSGNYGAKVEVDVDGVVDESGEDNTWELPLKVVP